MDLKLTLLVFAVFVRTTVWCEESAETDDANLVTGPATAAKNPDLVIKKEKAYSELLRRGANSWRPWQLLRWGQNLFNNGASSDDDVGSYGSHGGHGQHKKLKNKVKLILKVHQYEATNTIMFYVDSPRTLTRRESSLVVPKRSRSCYFDELDLPSNLNPLASSVRLTSDSCTSLFQRPVGTVRKELITLLFEHMIKRIVLNWKVISKPKTEDVTPNNNDTASNKLRSKSKAPPKSSKLTRKGSNRSRTEMELYEESLPAPWWSGPDERAIIYFANGCKYEGDISMKVMHGTGRFQWADGTVYMGHFKNNEICGEGKLFWKDDTWYEGEFEANIRHGRGIFVDSRSQRSYIGDWYSGMKHGKGVIYYGGSMKNSYDGDWVFNVRQGFGSREYGPTSGYKGEWDYYVREGKGIMIWPNHDFYSGDWKNGVMSGYGLYIWDFIFNSSMSLPAFNVYHGEWLKGQRNGYGKMFFGVNMGSHYKGAFQNNLKHGYGKLVSNCGAMLQHKKLFVEDNMLMPSIETPDDTVSVKLRTAPHNTSPRQTALNDDNISLVYHIEQVLNTLDNQEETRHEIVNEFFINNRNLETISLVVNVTESEPQDVEDFIIFEERGLKNAIRCYETELRQIYYSYATVFNNEEIYFTPIMIRLQLWQLYYDCGVHKKGLALVEIDRLFSQNPEWLAKNPHNPFERVYFWQFMQSLICVARVLFARRKLPQVKPDTVLGTAFRMFMDAVIIPGAGLRSGRFLNIYKDFIPIKSLYGLYCSIGEPHSVRQFLCAIRAPPHLPSATPYNLYKEYRAHIPVGHNVCLYGEDINYVTEEPWEERDDLEKSSLHLFNFANLSSLAVINIFAEIFPQISNENAISNLNIQLTFFEFMEAFFACMEASICLDEEQRRVDAEEIEDNFLLS